MKSTAEMIKLMSHVDRDGVAYVPPVEGLDERLKGYLLNSFLMAAKDALNRGDYYPGLRALKNLDVALYLLKVEEDDSERLAIERDLLVLRQERLVSQWHYNSTAKQEPYGATEAKSDSIAQMESAIQGLAGIVGEDDKRVIRAREDVRALREVFAAEPFRPVVVGEPWVSLLAFHGGLTAMIEKLEISAVNFLSLTKQNETCYGDCWKWRAAFEEAGLPVPEVFQ